MQNETQSTLCYRVNGLELDLGTCELRHDGDVINLPKLSFDLLASLARHAPNVVTIDGLIEDVWDGRIVSEETVTQRVKLLRGALAEHGYTKQLITTVRGRGYRLASPVERLDTREEVDEPVETPPYRRFVRAGLYLALVVGLGIAASRLLPIDPFEAVDDKSIAVLPFADFTADRKAGYLGDGIAEELLNRFAQIPGLHVASRTSSFKFRDGEEDIRSIADQLGVRNVLEGSVRKSDGRLRITVQLIDAVDDRHIWSEQFDSRLTDVLAVQEQIAAAVVDRFRLALPIAASRAEDIDPRALDLYMQGRHDLRTRTATSLESAVKTLEMVIEIQPDFAPGYAALAAAYIDLPRRGNFSMDEAERRAGSALEKALELDSNLAEAHATLGLLRMVTSDLSGAQLSLRRAIELNPNLAEAHLWLGHSLRGQNRFDEARELFERALLLDPMNVAVIDALTFDLMGDGDYDAAIRQFQRRLRIEPAGGETYRLMAMTARTFGRLDSAVQWAREAVAADPDGPLNINELVMAYSAIGEMGLAAELADQAYSMAPDNHWVALLKAFTYINSGDFDSLNAFADDQLALVATSQSAVLSQADRIRLAIGGLASMFSRDYSEAERRIELALGDPLTSLLEIQFSIGLLGALGYAYDQNGKPDRAEETLQMTLELIGDQKGWVFQHLIYADSIASIQLMRGDRHAAIATMRQAIADGWTGHRGFLHSPLWRELYESDGEFRAMMDELYSRIDAMRESIRPLDQPDADDTA